MSARACSGAAARQASSENPDTVFSPNRLRTSTLPSSPAEAPKTTARPDGASSPRHRRSVSPPPDNAVAHGRDGHPVYRFWHGHISALIAAQRPGADAEMIAHLLLGSLHSEPVLTQLAAEGPARLTAAMRTLAGAVLSAP
jgi:hypothetical protein